MHSLNLHYFPLALPFFFMLVVLLGVVIALVQIRVLRYAYGKIGIPLKYFYALLIASLIGSYVNIPVASLPSEQTMSGQIVTYFGMQYVIPEVIDWPGTVIAVNVGGAVIPLLVSLYLAVKFRIYGPALLGIAVVALVSHLVAHPVRGMGIAEPVFVPTLVTAFTALLISRKYAAPIAYISGSMGTLIGADLLNLDRIRGLGAPVASIGGAGTFDGIFLTSILAVVLAGLLTERDPGSGRR
jgi:uncharacterized membrane protein